MFYFRQSPCYLFLLVKNKQLKSLLNILPAHYILWFISSGSMPCLRAWGKISTKHLPQKVQSTSMVLSDVLIHVWACGGWYLQNRKWLHWFNRLLIHARWECLIKSDCHWDPWASAAPHLSLNYNQMFVWVISWKWLY